MRAMMLWKFRDGAEDHSSYDHKINPDDAHHTEAEAENLAFDHTEAETKNLAFDHHNARL